MKGRYIALEGIEGAGKSTAAEQLIAAIEAHSLEVVLVREPGGTPAGERIRDVLLNRESRMGSWTEALLFAAARSQLARDIVGPALQRGAWVVSDRSVYSSLAYQGGGRGLGVPAVRAINEPGLEGVWPDLVILLRLDTDTGLGRQEIADRIGGEGPEFQDQVAATFDELAAASPDLFAVVDASTAIETVVARMIEEVESRWPPE